MKKNYYEIEEYPFLKQIIANIDIIGDELKNALKKDKEVQYVVTPKDDDPNYLDGYTNYWVEDNGFTAEQIGYDIREGGYFSMALFKKGYKIKSIDVEKNFPKTIKILQEIPNIYFAAFFKMNAHSVLNSHTHTRRHLIFHLLMNDLENGVCRMTVNGEEKIISKKGDTVLFDYSLEHGTTNESDSDRYNLAIDFNPFE